jgi:hypothetical protein
MVFVYVIRASARYGSAAFIAAKITVIIAVCITRRPLHSQKGKGARAYKSAKHQ